MSGIEEPSQKSIGAEAREKSPSKGGGRSEGAVISVSVGVHDDDCGKNNALDRLAKISEELGLEY